MDPVTEVGASVTDWLGARHCAGCFPWVSAIVCILQTRKQSSEFLSGLPNFWSPVADEKFNRLQAAGAPIEMEAKSHWNNIAEREGGVTSSKQNPHSGFHKDLTTL